MAGNHAEQKQLVGNPAELQTAPLSQLGYINTVGGHTADSLVWISTRQIFFPLAGITQRATIVPGAKADVSRCLHI